MGKQGYKLFCGRMVRVVDYATIDWNKKQVFHQEDKVYELNFYELFKLSFKIINNLLYGRYYEYLHHYDDLKQECAKACMYIFAVFANQKGRIFSLLKTYYSYAILKYIRNYIWGGEINVFSLDAEISEDSETTLFNFYGNDDEYDLIDTSVFTFEENLVYKLLLAGYNANEIFVGDLALRRMDIIPSIKAKLCFQLEKDPRSNAFKNGKNQSIQQYYRNFESSYKSRKKNLKLH